MKTKCEHCDGTGQRDRTKEEDGAEADSDLHPMLAKSKKTCEKCGGAGKV